MVYTENLTNASYTFFYHLKSIYIYLLENQRYM